MVSTFAPDLYTFVHKTAANHQFAYLLNSILACHSQLRYVEKYLCTMYLCTMYLCIM